MLHDVVSVSYPLLPFPLAGIKIVTINSLGVYIHISPHFNRSLGHSALPWGWMMWHSAYRAEGLKQPEDETAAT